MQRVQTDRQTHRHTPTQTHRHTHTHTGLFKGDHGGSSVRPCVRACMCVRHAECACGPDSSVTALSAGAKRCRVITVMKDGTPEALCCSPTDMWHNLNAHRTPRARTCTRARTHTIISLIHIERCRGRLQFINWYSKNWHWYKASLSPLMMFLKCPPSYIR